MTHQFESGFFVAQPAWHHLGELLQQPPTIETAIVKAGLDWQVLEALVTRPSSGDEAPNTGLAKQLIRSDNRRVLGIVPCSYTPLPNRDAFLWLNPFIEQGHLALEAAGSLQGGRRVWVLARVCHGEREVRPGDSVRPYLLLHNSHDGSTAVWIQFTPVRVVCMNTLAGAAASRYGDMPLKKAICLPHTATLPEHLAKLEHLIDLTNREFRCSVGEYRAMAAQELQSEQMFAYFFNVFRRPNSRRAQTPDAQNYPSLAELTRNFEQGQGNQGRSLWDAYNAVTEWIDHRQSVGAEERLMSSWFAAGLELRNHAHQIAIEILQNRSFETVMPPRQFFKEQVPLDEESLRTDDLALLSRHI